MAAKPARSIAQALHPMVTDTRGFGQALHPEHRLSMARPAPRGLIALGHQLTDRPRLLSGRVQQPRWSSPSALSF